MKDKLLAYMKPRVMDISKSQDPPCTLNWGYMVPNNGYLGPNRGQEEGLGGFHSSP